MPLRLPQFLSERDTDPPSHPDQGFVRAGSPIERPRSYIGIEGDRVALTKTNPPEGVYFQDLQEGTFYQWVGGRWEAIGQTFLGDLALSDPGLAPRATPRPYSFGGGGSQSQVGGPPGSGNPILNPITPPAGVVLDSAILLDFGPAGGTLVVGVPQTLFSGVLSGGWPDPADPNYITEQALVNFNYRAGITGVAGDALTIRIFINSVLADTLNDPFVGGSTKAGFQSQSTPPQSNIWIPGATVDVEFEAVQNNLNFPTSMLFQLYVYMVLST